MCLFAGVTVMSREGTRWSTAAHPYIGSGGWSRSASSEVGLWCEGCVLSSNRM